MDIRRLITEETKKFALAPTFFIYVCGILIFMISVFFPETASLTAELETGDTEGFALARLFMSGIGSLVLFLPAFAVATSVVRDKETINREGELLGPIFPSHTFVLVRVVTQSVLLFIPVFLAAVYMTSSRLNTPGAAQFLALAFIWVLPAILFETALVTAVTEWCRMCVPGILVSLVVWVFSQGSTADLADFNSCVAVRHEVYGGFAEYASALTALTINRIAVLALAAAFTVVAVAGNGFMRRKANKA